MDGRGVEVLFGCPVDVVEEEGRVYYAIGDLLQVAEVPYPPVEGMPVYDDMWLSRDDLAEFFARCHHLRLKIKKRGCISRRSPAKTLF